MSELIYEASVYERTISYKNFKGDVKEVTLYFALDPMKLMGVISSFQPKKIKSGNPALAGKEAPITSEEQLKLVRDLVVQAAGSPSEDGESWIPWVDFENDLVGQAFMAKLTSSDGDRAEFSEKVILDPFRAFVRYAEVDPTNTAKDRADFKRMLGELENIFKEPEAKGETLEEKRARLAAELASIESGPAEGTQGDNGISAPGNS